MQHRFNRSTFSHGGQLPAAVRAIVLAASLAAALPSSAVELGDIAVRSYLNQPLTADIELVMLAPDEVDGVPVRIASANIYQGANVRMHPALAGARLSIQKKDQRLFVHVVTMQPIDTDVVHLFLELGSGSRAVVRAATVWLTPEPPGAARPVRAPSSGQALAPAPLPPPVSFAPPPARPVPAAPADAPEEASLPAAKPARASAPAAAAVPAAGYKAVRPLPSTVPAPGTAEPALPGQAPSEAMLIAARARLAADLEARARREAHGGSTQTAMTRAACTPGKGEARQCVVLDQKNMELNAKIHDLEGKVQALQSALGAAHGAPGTAPATAVAPGGVTGAAPAGTPPGAPGAAASVPAAAAAASAGTPASPAAGTASSATASAPPAAGGAAASAPPSAAASAASSASAPMNPAGSVIPPSANHANGNGKRRPGGLNATMQILIGSIAGLALAGGLVYLVRKKKLKLPPREQLMFWKRWKRKQAEPEQPPVEPELQEQPPEE